MAANTQIGNVTTMNVKSYDNSMNEYNNKIWGKLNPTCTYSDVDTFARALYGLSTNRYDDTTLITEKSVNEEMDDE